jgi:hypothetical protein
VVAPRILRSRDIRTSLYSTRKVTKRKHAPGGATYSCASMTFVPDPPDGTSLCRQAGTASMPCPFGLAHKSQRCSE